MHKKLTFSSLLLALAVTLVAQAQEPPNMEEMMKKWQAFATPGEGHKLLDQFVGNWDLLTRTWMEGPDKPPMETKGSTTVQWVLGGRYLREDYSSNMMDKPMHGFGFTGYDNFKQKYVSVWMDDMGTGIFYCEGIYNPIEKAFYYFGQMDDPSMDQRDKPAMLVYRILDPDRHVFEMHDLEVGGPNTKVFEMVYTRKK